MGREKLPDPVLAAAKLQPLKHQDIIDFLKRFPRDEKSDVIRACLRIGRDHLDLLEKYLQSPPEQPQLTLEDLETA